MQQQNEPKFATAALATGVRLHYAERGDPDGEAIIFLHGYSDSWFSFSRVLPLLSDEYHAFALTERGHGDSEKPECCYTLDDFAADVDAFMDAVGIERATIVGHSNGSIMAPRVALDYPSRVSRLVLIGSATIAATAEGDNEMVQGFMEEVSALEDPVPSEFVRESASRESAASFERITSSSHGWPITLAIRSRFFLLSPAHPAASLSAGAS